MIITPQHTIGIIGGTGKTGGQFAQIFEDAGFTVSVTGSQTKMQNRKLLAECDIVIFTPPLHKSVAIMKTEIEHATRENQLILDLCSLKQKQVSVMNKAAGEVIGLHPLFGPTTDHKGQKVIVCPGNSTEETVESLESLLSQLGMLTRRMKPMEHDRLMSLLQVLPHLKSFLLADVLRKVDANVDEILDTCSPAYELELNVVGRFLDDNPDLYGPIILDNPDTLRILKTFRSVLDDCIEMAEKEDHHLFTERYERLQEFFGENTKRGRESAEECIKTLVKHKQSSPPST